MTQNLISNINTVKIKKFIQYNIFFIITLITFILLLSTWFILQRIPPNFTILKNPPQVTFQKVSYLGDNNMIFRANAIYLQNAGDTFGRITGLREYDYKTVYQWLKLLESFDAISNYTPALASYYFGVTDMKSDLPYIMQFLEENYHIAPEKKWWWLYIAVHIAYHKLNDHEKALQLSKLLASTKGNRIPKWAKEMPAFILEKKGELEEALKVIQDVAENYDDFAQTEINFMNYFIKERLGFAEQEIKKQAKIMDTNIVY